MRLWSPDWRNGEALPERHARARLDGLGRLVPSANLSPALKWSGLPAGTRALVLLALDLDALDLDALVPTAPPPGPGDDWPADAPRHESVFWLVTDLSPAVFELAEGQPGYAGPQPAPNDALVHHLVFALYALAVPRLEIDGQRSAQALRQAIGAHVLGSATHSGTCTLNGRLLGLGPAA